MSGRIVQYDEGISNDRISLDVSHLPNGVYSITAQTQKGVLSRKVVVQH